MSAWLKYNICLRVCGGIPCSQTSGAHQLIHQNASGTLGTGGEMTFVWRVEQHPEEVLAQRGEILFL